MMCGVCFCGHTGGLSIKGMLECAGGLLAPLPPFDGPRTCGCRLSSRFRRSLRDWESLCGRPAISILAVFNCFTFFTAAPMRASLTGEDWWPLRMSHCSARSACLQDLLSLWYFSRQINSTGRGEAVLSHGLNSHQRRIVYLRSARLRHMH